MGSLAPVDDSQFDVLLKAVAALKTDSVWHWQSAIPIFLSSFLGLLTGIFLDMIRRRMDRHKASDEKNKQELQQIKCALTGIGYNIQTLIHLAAQNLLPHHAQSERAHIEFRHIGDDRQKMAEFVQNLRKYPALFMTCPPLYFVELDFLDKLPFLTEMDSNIVMESARQIELSRRADALATERNRLIDLARSATMQTGMIGFPQLDVIIQSLESLAVCECVTCLEALEAFQIAAKSLQKTIELYRVSGKPTRLIIPCAIEDIISQLRIIRDKATSRMPGVGS